MNGSRSIPPRPAKASSLDALSRTIEGLEARIEGLMSGTASDGRTAGESYRDTARARTTERTGERLSERTRDRGMEPAGRFDRDDDRRDPLSEIRERQRALEASRNRQADRSADRRAALGARDAAPPRQAPAGPDLVGEISRALVNLRQDLKTDISEGLTREMRQLRSEMQSLSSIAAARAPDADIREELARLTHSVSQLGRAAPATEGFSREFDELRSLIDGLAREDSVRDIDNRWTGIERQLSHFDGDALRDELGRLVFRLDEIKTQIGHLGDNRAIRVVEEKLIAVANALEQIGTHIDPGERALHEQFAGLDLRLDEISRAIVAGNRAAPVTDNRGIERLEERLSGLARQIDLIVQQPVRRDEASEELAERLELLAERVEQLAGNKTALRLEERLDHLSALLERSHQPAAQPELTDALVDISRKIDALESGAVNDQLAQRLDRLARVIENLEHSKASAPATDDRLLRSLDDRLAMIAERLDDTRRMPANDGASLRGLEEQIAHLSGLLNSSPRASGGELDADLAGRLTAIEDYMATSDEYIIEAARQAAETVMANYAHQSRGDAGPAPAEMEAIAALTGSLRHLEDLSRHSEERNNRTLESLQDTLLDIADRLEQLHHDAAPSVAPLAKEAPTFARDPVPAAHDVSPVARLQSSAASAFAEPSEPIDLLADSDIAVTTEPARVDAGEKTGGKPSLLSGLSKRFLPSRGGKDDTAATSRQMIEPSPSIDPADVLPPEEANELLEPGSGAPDVRKILERVRAAKAKSGDQPGEGESDRTDYIAAARRAAQAAAQEASKATASQPSAGSKASAGSLFSHYRRPILMAAGAILLAVMALPLVKTLTRSEAPTPAPVIEAPAASTKASPPPLEPAPATPSKAPEQSQLTAPSDGAAPTGFAANAPPLEDEIDAGVAEMPVVPDGEMPMGEGEVVAPKPATNEVAKAELAAPATAPEATQLSMEQVPPAEAAPTFEVPASITPPSLAKAAADGDPLALFEIGARYTEGRGVEISLAEAALWYQRAADKGFAPAQYRLGNLYEKGTGVQRDPQKARELYEKAGASGNASAMHNLAVLHASGGAGAQDYAKAAEWFSKAAEHGVSDSQFNLAILYARGNGVKQDLESSYKWFAIAAKEGDKDAAQKRDDVAQAMTPEQIERARTQADVFKPAPLNVDANSVDLPDEWVGKGVKTASVDMTKVVRNVQAILNNNGFDAGSADGVMGKKTVAAIKAFQSSIGQEPTGQINDALVTELLARNK